MSQQHTTAPINRSAADSSSATTAQGFRRTRVGAGLAAVAALAFGALLMGPTSPALAHDQLVGTEIVTATDDSVESIRLTFSNSIMEVGTDFVVTDANGQDATAGLPEVSGPDVIQPLAEGLEAGDYAGAWRVVSSDGHPIDGAFTLTIDAAGAAEMSEAAPIDDHEAGQAGDATGTEPTNGQMPEAPSSLYVFLAIGGVLVIVVVAASFVARSRRLAQMQREADQAGTDTAEGNTK